MSPGFVVRVTTIAGICLLWVHAGFAQSTGTGTARPPAGGNGGAATGTPPTGTVPPISNPNNNKQNVPASHQTLYVTGRVAMEDGSPLPEPVTIERVCASGQPRAEGYTDSRGNFGVQVGDETGVFQDASEEAPRSTFPGGSQSPAMAGGNANALSGGGPMGSAMGRFQNCELRAKLAGYRSQTINLANRRPLDDPNVGTILLHKLGPDAGNTVSAGALNAPKDARKAFDRGMQAVKKNKPEDAGKEFAKAVELYPSYAEAWFELGRIQGGRGQNEEARQSYNASIKADPKFVGPYVQLAILSMQSKNWPELQDLTDRGMRLDSFDYPQLFLFNAVANYNLHKFDLAERSLKQAIRLDTQHRFPDIQHLMGLVLVVKKDYTGAAEQFREFLKMVPDSADAPKVRAQLSEVEHLTAQNAEAVAKDR